MLAQLRKLAVRILDARQLGESPVAFASRLVKWRIRSVRTSRANVGRDEARAVARVLRSRKIAYGPEVDRFQSEFARMYGVRRAVCSTSGTSAIHTALAMLDIQPGDEVIVPPITDIGTILPVLAMNAIPVFADVDPESWNMDPRAVEECITENTRAIIAVHLFGNPCDMDALLEIRDHHGLKLVEDCAQAHWTHLGDRLLGTIGDVGAFSLQWSKHITSCEGGVVICNDEKMAEKGDLFVNKGWNKDVPPGARQYPIFGFNYRMTELQAAMGRVQLGKLRNIVETRQRNAAILLEKLADLPNVRFQKALPDARPSYWQFGLSVDPSAPFSVDSLARTLDRRKLGAVAHYIGKPIHHCHGPLLNRRVFGDSDLPFSLSNRSVELDYSEMKTPVAQGVLDHMAILRAQNENLSERMVLECAKEMREVVDRLSDPSKMQSKPSARYTVGVVGCGRIAEQHLDAVARMPELSLKAVSDVNETALKTVASRFGATATYRDYAELIEKELPDILLILLWPTLHAEVSIAALEKGVKAVVCEKPMASNLAEAQAMREALARSGSSLIVGHQHRFNPHVERARELIRSGEIGTVRHAWVHCGGTLIDNGSHVIDGLLYMLEEPEVDWVLGQIHREDNAEDKGQPVESGSIGLIHFADGVRANIEMGSNAPSSIGWHFHGDLGKIDVYMDHLDVVGRKHKRMKRVEFARVASPLHQLQEVVACLDDPARKHRGDAEYGYTAFEVLIGLLESASIGKIISLPVTQMDYPLRP